MSAVSTVKRPSAAVHVVEPGKIGKHIFSVNTYFKLGLVLCQLTTLTSLIYE